MSNNTKQHIKYFLVYAFIGLFVYSFITPITRASLQSTTYQINDYGFGSGGTSGNTSTTYSLFGVSGQPEIVNPLTSTTYQLGPGLTYLLKTNVPGAPTLTTPGNNYDRIYITLNTSSNPSDTLFAIELSTTSNFSTGILYAKSDFTTGTTLTTTDYKTNANWGITGFFVTGLKSGTTYYVRVKASQGAYTESEWGPSTSITTNTPTLSLNLSSNTLAFSPLNGTNTYTDSSKSTTLTSSTNAYNGYIIYGRVTQPLTAPDGAIANYGSPNSAPTAWSGTGFGYTTNDTALTGGTANRFSNGTLYAGFSTSGNGDPVASDVGPVTASPITNEQFIVSYRVTASNTTPAETYKTTILYTIVPAY